MRMSFWLRSAHSFFVLSGAEKGSFPTPLRKRALAVRLSVERLEDRALPSTFTVLDLADSGAGSLRQAVLDANANPGHDVIQFAPGLQGTIALTSGQLAITDDLEIDGPGADRLAVSGSDASRVFKINSSVPVTIDGLTITHGRAVGAGGGILNAGALTISNAILSDNQVGGVPGATLSAVVDAFGGGIFNSGTLTVSDSNFVHNQSIGADGTPSSIGSSALGGAIMSGGTALAPATATVSDSTFLDNQAIGGAAGAGASRAGIGGAIANATGTFTVRDSVFCDNQAVGGLDNGVPGGFGAGAGGAIGNVARFGNAILAVSDSTFLDNRAVGGAAGTGGNAQTGRGGAIANYIFGGVALPATVTANASVTDSTLIGNQAIGGAGPTGGAGQGGGISNNNGGVLNVSNSLIALNQAIGGAGDGGNGGNAQGGGIYNSNGTVTVSGSTLSANFASSGGGGIYNYSGGTVTVENSSSIIGNTAPAGFGADVDNLGVLYLDSTSTIGVLDGNAAIPI